MEPINQADENVHNEKEEQERTTVTKNSVHYLRLYLHLVSYSIC